MKTFLVTGGRGFIGSYFVQLCLKNGHKVIDVDKLTYAASRSLSWDKHPNYTFIEKDIKDRLTPAFQNLYSMVKAKFKSKKVGDLKLKDGVKLK